MKSTLTVKNFGPIDFVMLDLRHVNVFIGPQASGKSALAKLFTVCSAPRRFRNAVLFKPHKRARRPNL
jgi:predicted ATPase